MIHGDFLDFPAIEFEIGGHEPVDPFHMRQVADAGLAEHFKAAARVTDAIMGSPVADAIGDA